MKGILVLIGGALAGSYVFEKFIAKNPATGSGFVEVSDGLGLDDIARAGTIAAVILLGRKFIG